MKPEFDANERGEAQFHTTRWTLVMVSAQSQAVEGKTALAELCRIYWYPLYSFARRRGHTPHDAQDLTQGFFLHLLEHRALTQVDRLKGKFRSFLLASFQNYLSNEAQRARSLKRGKEYEFVSLDWESAESRYRLEPADYLTAEKDFRRPLGDDLAQPRHVGIGSRLRRRRQGRHLSSTGDLFAIRRQPSSPSYEELAETLGVSPAV